MTTNILLALITVLLLARVILQIRQGKNAVEYEYRVGDTIREYSSRGFVK